MSISIVSRYRSEDVYESIKDKSDLVERSGYVSPDKKIESFIESGQLLQNYRASGSDYELQSEELEMDSDSDEYVEYLTNESENYSEQLMPQFIDKISANEILNEADKKIDVLKNAPKPKKSDSKKALETLEKIERNLMRETVQVDKKSE